MSINAGMVMAYLALDTSRFSTALSSSRSQMQDFLDSNNSAATRINSLGGAMESIGSVATKKLTLPILAAATSVTKLASDFETGMAKISTIADTSKVSISQIGDGIKKLSSDTGQSVNDLQEAVYESISSGIKTEDSVKFTETATKAAVGGFTDTRTAVDGLTTVLNAYGESADQATGLTNQMMIAQNLGKTTFGEMAGKIGNVAATSAAAGVSTKELFSSLAVLTANGIQTSEAVTGVKAALSNIIKPSDEATKAANALGLNFNVAELKSKGWMGFLQEVREKINQIAPEYAKASDKVAELSQKIKDAQSGKKATSEEYANAIANEKKAVDALEKSKDAAKSNDEKKKIQEEIEAHKDKIKALQEEAKQAGKTYSTEQINAWKKELSSAQKEQKLLQAGSSDKLSGLATMFGSVEALNSIAALTSDSGKALYDTSMKQMDDPNNKTADDAYNKMMDTPEMKMKKAMASIQSAGITLGEAFLPYMAKIADGITKVVSAFMGLPSPIKNAIGTLVAITAAVGPALVIFGKIVYSVSGIVGAFSKIGGAIRGVSTIVNGFKSAISIFSALPALLSPPILIAVAVIAGLGLIVYEVIKHWDAVKAAASAFIDALKNIFSGVGTFFKDIIKGWGIIFEGIGDLGGKLFDIGKNIVEGLINGIKAAYHKVVDTISSIGNAIKNGFKSILGINSPSRVFREYGGFIGDGLIEGIDNKQSDIEDKFGGLGNKIKDLGNVKPEFKGLSSMELNGAYPSKDAMGGISNTNASTRHVNVNVNPNITMNIKIADTGEKGTAQLKDELSAMANNSLKDTVTELVMKDVNRL